MIRNHFLALTILLLLSLIFFSHGLAENMSSSHDEKMIQSDLNAPIGQGPDYQLVYVELPVSESTIFPGGLLHPSLIIRNAGTSGLEGSVVNVSGYLGNISLIPVSGSFPTLKEGEEQVAEVKASEQGTVTSEPTKTPVSDNQEDLFSGTFSLPSGIVNITASSGGDYEIEGATPLGLLQKLKEDSKIAEISVSDRAMRKGGILLLEGINDYYYTGDKTWFVVVNDYQVKDYLYPETDGLNVYKIKAGDKVGYYFGEPSKPADDAEVKMLVTIE